MAENEINALDMSDDEFLNTSWDLPTEDETVTEDVETVEDVEDVVEETIEEEEVTSDDDETTDELEETLSEESEAEEADQEDETEEETEKSDEIDYKGVYEQLFAPFKANGREIQIESVDDAIQLMQMGAGFNKKMAALKPGLKVLKMLENNSLMDEDKLSFFVDLDKKDPNAIRKLIQDSGIDVHELLESDETYTPKSHAVDDRELALDEVLDSIQSTPTFQSTIETVTKEWDAQSRSIVVQNPATIRIINEHKQNGIYDQIAAEMGRDKALGRLAGVPDIEAYRLVGDRLHKQGAFDEKPAKQEETPTKTKAPSKPDPKVVSKKRKAAPTKPGSPASEEPEFNPLSLSDEEFEKQLADKYL